MTDAPDYRPVLAYYPPPFRPATAEFLGAAGGFSGALFWRLATPRGPLCLRRWPREHPSQERLEFIQAVLWHVWQEGFRLVPLPLETLRHAGYVRHADHLWELSPWMPGRADYLAHPSPRKLEAALAALARFHLAAASFPLPDPGPCLSPGIGERAEQLADLRRGGLARLKSAVRQAGEDGPCSRAWQLLELAPLAADRVYATLRAVAHVAVALQPCLRDIWHDHVLYQEEAVSAFVDFGALRAENVATDVARLVGSLAGDDGPARERALAAYEAVRPLSANEARLVAAFDESGVLLSGVNWLTWIYLQGRQFADPKAVADRLDQNLARLAHLAGIAKVGPPRG
jgi:Ser/Thr protein kinase RdoA (MazF antagonist)